MPLKNKLSGKKLRDLLSHFSKYRLRNSDFEKPDLVHDITARKEAEQKLRDSEAHLQNQIKFTDMSLDAQQDTFFVFEPATGKTVRWNKAFREVSGYSDDEISELPAPASYYSPADLERAESFHREILESGAGGSIELSLICKDGSRVPTEYRAGPLYDESGELKYIISIGRDITERKQAETELLQYRDSLEEIVAERTAKLSQTNAQLQQSEMKLRIVADNTSDWEYWRNPQGQLSYCSPSCKRITGHAVEEFQADAGLFFSIIHPDDREKLRDHRHTVTNEGDISELEFRINHADGGIKWIGHVCQAIHDAQGTYLGRCGSNRDITDRKTTEQELALSSIELEAANQELEAFSYSVSHDLRTPLRAIDGFSEMLLEDYANQLDTEGKRLLNVVRDNTVRMGKLIDDILQFSRTGRLPISIAIVDMERLARTVIAELQPGVDAGKLQLDMAHLPPAKGDLAMLRQVWVNLLSNAIKFSRARETARIEVGGHVEGNEAIYSVKDNGAGFDMRYVDKLFGVFQRLHGADEFEGTGIGLAIVKRIVTRHGGRVWAEGRVNEGATFYFTLPTGDNAHD